MTNAQSDFIVAYKHGLCLPVIWGHPDRSPEYCAGWARGKNPPLCDLHKSFAQVAREAYPEPPSDPATT